MAGTYQADVNVLLRSTIDLARKAANCCGKLDRLDDFDDEQLSEMYAILHALHREALNDAESLEGLSSIKESSNV